MTVYSPNIPQPSDIPSQSQDLILQNFQSIDNAFTKNHIALSDTANRGLHKFLTMPIQGAAPGSAAAQGVFYTKTVAGSSELFMERDGVATEIQLTSGGILAGSPGYTFLPGPQRMMWGTFNTTDGTHVITYAGIGLPDFTGVPGTNTILLTPTQLGGGTVFFRAYNAANTGFTIDTGGVTTYYFMVIGTP